MNGYLVWTPDVIVTYLLFRTSYLLKFGLELSRKFVLFNQVNAITPINLAELLWYFVLRCV